MIGAILALAVQATSPTQRAETLAEQAVRLAATKPAEGLAQARRALELTADFEPTAFVDAGRKGEVVEDAYLAARGAYRRHRARLYQAIGLCLAGVERHAEAVRYLRRANRLDPELEPTPLARSLVASGRAREALDQLLVRRREKLGPDALAVAASAADALGLASLQAELDHARIAGLAVKPPVEHRDGPFRLPLRVRLSTGEPLRLDAGDLSVLYVAEPSCRTCSADLTALQRVVSPGTTPRLVPMIPERDQALRQVVKLYRLNWPYLLGQGEGAFLGVPGPAALLVGRGGWSAAVARPPLEQTLAPALAILARRDVAETPPRAGWNGRPAERKPATAPPALLPEGVAPGEDDPAPPEFDAAVAAFRASQPREALRLFGALEARGDGWLLPPEARLNRALCLANLGQREAARLLLLRTGDSRFEEAVDRALETVNVGRRP